MDFIPLLFYTFADVYGDEPDKLVNGIPTTIQEYPHCVSLRQGNSHFCGGSIIGDRFIVTAAHCVESLIRSPLQRAAVTVVTGTTYLNSGGQSYRLENVWRHESYNPNHPAGRGPYDIGLIKLSSPIQYGSTVQKVNLPTRAAAANEAVTIAAWGSTGFRQGIHNNLQKLHAKIMLPNTCAAYHRNLMPVDQTEICTLISMGTGLCNGDSGSGLIRDSDRTIIGLVSGGKPCAQGVPDVYTNVFSHLSWIQQKMRQ
ncbi:hypothetical protein PUN28_018214 [Cardiocondyla obscurior]|uniref:Peptidase S1 domain-containing protein n=1 Tax=Cardiocondyla obscurior TaxID=286306 RepID=A0AAW2EGC4_9HYME